MMNYFRNTEEFHIDFMVCCFFSLCFGCPWTKGIDDRVVADDILLQLSVCMWTWLWIEVALLLVL